MSHPLHNYLTTQLQPRLQRRRVVVWYDPAADFAPYLDELPPAATTANDALARIRLGDMEVWLARFDGSYFALRMAVEPYVSGPLPEPLLVYVPSAKPEAAASVLLELETAGDTYEPQLKRLARTVLRQKYGDGEIDQLLAPERLTYQDVVRLLSQGNGDGSLLKLVFPDRSGDPLVLLAAWLANEDRDAAVEEKQAERELMALIEMRLGLPLAADAPLAAARAAVLRYVLVNEFRADLRCDPPSAVALIPATPSADHLQRVRDLAARLRHDYPHAYAVLADQVQVSLQLAQAGLDPAALGSLDTFRFEEQALLGHVGQLIAQRHYSEALTIIEARRRSFWLSLWDEQQAVRAAQWQASHLMAELGLSVRAITHSLVKPSERPEAWLQAYTAEDGWHEADALYRDLEAWVANMDDQPECDQALGVVRAEYEKLLSKMAEGFTSALQAADWTVPGVLHQTHVFPEVVERGGTPVAYFLVDSLRYEMGVELRRQLAEAQDLVLRPALAALPTVTCIGMAALLPGASGSFSVVKHAGKLAARIEGATLPSWSERRKYLLAVRPDTVEMTLDEVVQSKPAKLNPKIGSAALIVVRSTEIDVLGETGNELLARQFINTVIGNLARAIRTLAKAGVACFVVSADHGHQLASRKERDMTMDSPGPDGIKAGRRCWAGQGGTTPAGAVRVTGAELGYDTDLDFIFPIGTGVFAAAGGLAYHHGGASLQELVVPVLSLRMPTTAAEADKGVTVTLAEHPEVVTNRVIPVKVLFTPHLLNREPLPVRVVLIADGKQVGRAQMVLEASFDQAAGQVTLVPGQVAAVALLLSDEQVKELRAVVQDPATDAVLVQSPPLPVKLGI